MSVRPPTLREKKRYLLARIDPSGIAVDPKDLYYAMYEAVVSLFGDMAAASMQPSVLTVEDGYAILRCRRGAEREFAIALSTLTSYRETPLALRIRAISGTVESLRERLEQYGEPETVSKVPDTTEFVFASVPVEVVNWNGHKVDVIEKGFKNTRRLFLTEEDLERNHATTIPDGV